MKCPRDSQELEIASQDESSIYACSTCLGVWIDLDSRLIDEIDRDEIRIAVKKEKLSSEIDCPNDGSELLELSHSSITIDVCPQCYGLWLDEGELQKIRNEATNHTVAKSFALVAIDPIAVDLVPLLIRYVGRALASLAP